MGTGNRLVLVAPDGFSYLDFYFKNSAAFITVEFLFLGSFRICQCEWTQRVDTCPCLLPGHFIFFAIAIFLL